MRKGVTFLVVMFTVLAMTATHAPVAEAGILRTPWGAQRSGLPSARSRAGMELPSAQPLAAASASSARRATKRRNGRRQRGSTHRSVPSGSGRNNSNRIASARTPTGAGPGELADAVPVSETQRSLVRLGYDPGSVGTMNPQTTAPSRPIRARRGSWKWASPPRNCSSTSRERGRRDRNCATNA